MPDGQFKTTAVMVATKRRTSLYKAVDELPAEDRRRLQEAIHGDMSATILIADQRGQDEVARLLREAWVRRSARREEKSRKSAQFLMRASLVAGAVLLGWVALMIYS